MSIIPSNERPSSSSSDYNRKQQQELERSLRDVLKSIPVEYKDSKQFSHIAVVARALKKARPQDDLQELNRHFESLNDAVSDIVDANYKGFNKSIRNFSDILSKLETSRNWVNSLERNIANCEDLLASRSNGMLNDLLCHPAPFIHPTHLVLTDQRIATDLAQLYSTYLQHTEFLKILRMVEEVKEVPLMLQHSIKTKHYLYSVRQILKYEEMLEREELRNIAALEEIRQSIKEHKTSLPDRLVDELNNHCFHYSGSNIKLLTQLKRSKVISQRWDTSVSSSSNTNAKLSSTHDILDDGSKEIERNIRTRVRRMTIKSGTAPPTISDGKNPTDKISEIFKGGEPLTTDQDEQLEDDPSMNIELDRTYFIQTVVEALDKLECLPYAQSRLIQSLRFELHSLVDDHIAKFAKQFESSDAAWTLQNLKQSSKNIGDQSLISGMGTGEQHSHHFFKALFQGQPLVDMLQSLFTKLSNVLRNFKFVIRIMGDKFSIQTAKQQQTQTPDLLLVGFNDIKITKDIIARLRDAVRAKIEDIRHQKRSNTAYINALEDMLFNFLEKQDNTHLQGMKVSRIPDIFSGMLNTQSKITPYEDLMTKKRRLSEAKQDFNNLLFNSLSSPDIPRVLTLEHIWHTIQDELKMLLRDILGVTSDDLDNQSTQQKNSRKGSLSEQQRQQSSSQQQQRQYNDKGALSNEDKNRGRSNTLRFRFRTNIEYSPTDTQAQGNRGRLSSESLSSFVKFFSFTPYNLMWLFRPLSEFINDMGTKMVEMIGADEHGNLADKAKLTSTLRDFVNNAVQKSLLERVRSDYRSYLIQAISQPDAFHPVDSLDFVSLATVKKEMSDKGTGRSTKPALLNSTVRLTLWLAELLQLSVSIPSYKREFLSIMESLLQQYLDECKNQFRQIVANKYVRECLDRSDILPLLQSDPQWKRIYLAMIDRQHAILDYDMVRTKSIDDVGYCPTAGMTIQLRNLLRELVDHELMKMDSIERYLLIDDLPSITLLATMNESLEWLTDQIVIISQWGELHPTRKTEFIRDLFVMMADKLDVMGMQIPWTPFQRPTMWIQDGEDCNNAVNRVTNVTLDPFYLLLLLNHNDSTKLHVTQQQSSTVADSEGLNSVGSVRIRFASKELEEFYRQLGALANRCLFALKLDIRVQCFFYLDAIKRSVYVCEEEPLEPEPTVKLFNSELSRIDACLSQYLPLEKSGYVFDGIAELISYILVNALPNMKHRKWNDLGVKKMKKNIFALEQNITNVIQTREVQTHFNYASRYYDLLLLSEKKLFSYILDESDRHLFSFDQYRAILETESPWHESSSSERAITVLSELFAQKRAVRESQEVDNDEHGE